MNEIIPPLVNPEQSASAADSATWASLVERIRTDDPSGMEELYRVFSQGIRFYLCRQLGTQDLDDRVHDIFLIVTQSIRRGDLREPDRLMGYVRTVLRRQVASHIEQIVHSRNNHADLEMGLRLSDRHPDPERSAIQNENQTLAMRVLHSLKSRDREVLVRFYLKEQAPEDICRELDLSATQFRLIKSRAKTRFIELAKRRFSLRNLVPQP
ncbi:MAG: sigma-70 family RNA polymerase sigma factor [Candidatus Sulfopaludibacter sp.]|nr:sigma-70 family RNA polymerase sigma factor [Candidatus Sulfopaludibacter sp.]